MFESAGLYGRSSLREVDPQTGAVMRSVPLDRKYFAEGITLVGNKIIMLTWKEKKGFVYDRDTFQLVREFDYSTSNGEGWGIAFDGEQLLVTDGSEHIHYWSTADLKETRRIRVLQPNGRPLKRLNELEFVCGELLSNIWYDDRIARIDPGTGAVTGYFDFSSLHPQSQRRGGEDVLNGIAVDADTMLMPAGAAGVPAVGRGNCSSSSQGSASRGASAKGVGAGGGSGAGARAGGRRRRGDRRAQAMPSYGGAVRALLTGKLWRYMYEVELETEDAPFCE